MCRGGSPRAPAPDQQPVRSQRILLSRAQYADLMIGSGNQNGQYLGGYGRQSYGYDGLFIPSPNTRSAGGGGSGSSMPTASGLRVVR